MAESILGVPAVAKVEQDEEGGDVGWSDQRPRKPADEVVAYLKSVGGSLASALDEDERCALVRNVLDEVSGHEASLACNRRTAPPLEALMREASAAQLNSVLNNMKRYFGVLCTDRQGSHVVQALLSRAHQVLESKTSAKAAAGDGNASDTNSKDADDSDASDDDQEGSGEAGQLALHGTLGDLCMTLVAKELWWDLMFDPCATHVVRSLLCVLAGKDPATLKAKRQTKGTTDARAGGARAKRARRSGKIELEMNASLHSFLAAMSKWSADDLKKACTDTYASPVAQLLLGSCKPRHKAWKAVLNKVLCPAGGDSCDPAVFELYSRDRIASHLMQIIVRSCDDQVFEDLIFQECLKGRMAEACRGEMSNYVLQEALSSMRTAEQCAMALEELEPELPTLLRSRLGVVWRLTEAAKRADKALQSRLCRAIVRAVRERDSARDSERKGAVEALLELRYSSKAAQVDTTASEAVDDGSGEGVEKEEAPAGDQATFTAVSVNVMGAKLVGALVSLAPESCRVVLESVASMSAAALKQCCLDPVAGRHMMEALMDAPAGAGWAKQRILQKLKDDVADIAASKFGCHVIRKAYDGGALKEKSIVARALGKKERRLAGTKHGKDLLKHCKVHLFKKHPDQWESAVKHTRVQKRKVVLDNLLDDLDKTHARLSAPKDAAPKAKRAKRSEPSPAEASAESSTKVKKKLF